VPPQWKALSADVGQLLARPGSLSGTWPCCLSLIGSSKPEIPLLRELQDLQAQLVDQPLTRSPAIAVPRSERI